MLRNGYCNLYKNICDKLLIARQLYHAIAQKELQLSLRAEIEAAEIAVRFSRPDNTCRLIEWLVSSLPGKRACILGPLYQGEPLIDCDVVLGVEQVLSIPVKIDLLGGDLDSLNRIKIYPSDSAKFWLIHVHGDNINLLYNSALPQQTEFKENIVFSNQAICLWPILGVGGFTDGDRLILLSLMMGASRIITYGFNFRNAKCVGKISCNLQLKKKKLEISKKMIEAAAVHTGYNIEYFSNDGQVNILLETVK